MKVISLKPYFPFAKGSFQSLLSYRINFFMFIFGEFLTVFVTYYLWMAVYKNSGSNIINGFSMSDMFAYIFMCEVARNFVFNDASADISYDVREGSIAMKLIHPINYRTEVLFRILGEVIYNILFVGVPIFIVVSLTMYFSHGIIINIMCVAGFLISCFLGFFMYFYFNFIFGLLAFFVTNVWGMNMLKGAIINFLSGLLVPISFFPTWAQKILSFMPFNSLIYTPVMIFLGKYKGTDLINALLIQLIWLIIFGVLGALLWKLAVKRLTISGG